MKLEIMRGLVSTERDIEIEVKDIVGINFQEKKIRYIPIEDPKVVHIYEVQDEDSVFIYDSGSYSK
jgi:hypothetical protein